MTGHDGAGSDVTQAHDAQTEESLYQTVSSESCQAKQIDTMAADVEMAFGPTDEASHGDARPQELPAVTQQTSVNDPIFWI